MFFYIFWGLLWYWLFDYCTRTDFYLFISLTCHRPHCLRFYRIQWLLLWKLLILLIWLRASTLWGNHHSHHICWWWHCGLSKNRVKLFFSLEYEAYLIITCLLNVWGADVFYQYKGVLLLFRVLIYL